MERGAVRHARIAIAVGGVALMVGVVLPWEGVRITGHGSTNGLFTENGLTPVGRTWGIVILVIGAMVLGFATSAPSRRRAKITALAGTVALILAVDSVMNVHSAHLVLPHIDVTWHRSVAFGLWLTTLAAIAVVVGSAWLLVLLRDAPGATVRAGTAERREPSAGPAPPRG